MSVTLDSRRGVLHPDLAIGANVAGVRALRANDGLSNRGVIPHGAGFIVTPYEARTLGLGSVPGLEARIRPYRNGKDLADRPRGALVIDLLGLTADQVRQQFPAVWQHLIERVKPDRDENNRDRVRELWWLFAEPRKVMRRSLVGLFRYIATGQVAKHRVFQFLDASILPDDKLIAIALDDAYDLGVLSSAIHLTWALAAGGRLGVGNDPVYSKSTCFDPFPFPSSTAEQQSRIRALAEELDAHRKRQQAEHPDLTLTGMYNVLEKLKSGEALTPRDQKIHADGLVSVLKTLHDEIDLAVLDAYAWNDLVPLLQVVNGNAAAGSDGTPPARDECRRALDDALLSRLVARNAERAAEEARGLVRWLRPEYQHPAGTAATVQPEQRALDVGGKQEAGAERVGPDARRPWPKDLADQIRAVAQVLADTRAPLPEAAIAARFTGRGPWKRRLPQLLDTLVAVGRARPTEGGYIGTP